MPRDNPPRLGQKTWDFWKKLGNTLFENAAAHILNLTAYVHENESTMAAQQPITKHTADMLYIDSSCENSVQQPLYWIYKQRNATALATHKISKMYGMWEVHKTCEPEIYDCHISRMQVTATAAECSKYKSSNSNRAWPLCVTSYGNETNLYDGSSRQQSV